MLFDRFAMRIFMYSRTVEDARPYNQDPIYARKSQFILQTNEKSKCCCPAFSEIGIAFSSKYGILIYILPPNFEQYQTNVFYKS